MKPKTRTTTTMLVVTRSGLRNSAAGVPLDTPVAPVLEAQPAPQFDADLLPDAAAELAGKTIDEIVEWVGSDPVRAAAALEANAASDNSRKTLPSRLAPVTDSLTKEN